MLHTFIVKLSASLYICAHTTW